MKPSAVFRCQFLFVLISQTCVLDVKLIRVILKSINHNHSANLTCLVRANISAYIIFPMKNIPRNKPDYFIQLEINFIQVRLGHLKNAWTF